MNTYRQTTPKSCGPDAVAWCLAQVAGISLSVARERVFRAWGWAGHGDVRDDLMDSPGQHEAVAKRLGIGFDLATLGELERGTLPPNQTVMLVHLSASNPAAQHWIVLAGYASDGRTRWHFGDGTIHELSRESVRELYSRFAPACVYVLGESAGDPLPWYARAWAGLIEKILGKR